MSAFNTLLESGIFLNLLKQFFNKLPPFGLKLEGLLWCELNKHFVKMQVIF